MRRYRKDDDGHEPVRVAEVQCTKQTERAILCVIEGEDVWVPQSLVHDDSEVYRQGDFGTLIVPKWFARKNGLTDE